MRFPVANFSIAAAWIVCIWWTCSPVAVEATTYGLRDNSTEVLSRHKRYLMFPEGGISKLLLGFATPIKNPANINLVYAANFQYQYNVPADIKFFTKYYPFSEAGRRKRNLEDDGRNIFYASVEGAMASYGVNGRECLLRTICEAAEAPVDHNGLIGELFHLLLTPPKREDNDLGDDCYGNGVESDYSAARTAGEQLYDCKELYPKCPLGHGLFDIISSFTTS